MLDVVLPLTLSDSNGVETFYFGRYLVHNQRLVGIRLASSKGEEGYANCDFKKWKSGKILKYHVPKYVLSFYREEKFPSSTY